jgi:hypothetical protein
MPNLPRQLPDGTWTSIEQFCPICHTRYRAARRTDTKGRVHYGSYCSRECIKLATEKRREAWQEFTCVQCQNKFKLAPGVVRQRKDIHCCSAACQKIYFSGERGATFKDGTYTHSDAGDKYILRKREGYVGSYVAEHRLIAGKAIGRDLRRGEVVIRLNRVVNDNRESNLFICASMSEYSKRRNGSLPWPTKSNLAVYK